MTAAQGVRPAPAACRLALLPGGGLPGAPPRPSRLRCIPAFVSQFFLLPPRAAARAVQLTPLAPCSVRALILLDLTSDPCLPSVMPLLDTGRAAWAEGTERSRLRQEGEQKAGAVARHAGKSGSNCRLSLRAAISWYCVSRCTDEGTGTADGLGFHVQRCVGSALSDAHGPPAHHLTSHQL